ncbi:MAG: FtsX-like permease family protein [Solirubrobacteraceae bacterium]
MRPYALFYIYRNRLRVHGAQELLAGVGVMVAVALVLATLVANGSLAGSAAQVIHTVVGPANLQLQARGPNGFDERLLPRVESLPGVKQAAPLLEQDARICLTPTHCAAINLAGTDLGLALLDELAHTLPISTLEPGGIALSKTTASELGIGARAHNVPVSVSLRGKATSLKVAAVLGPEAVGALSQAFVATMPLANMQKLAELRGRVTRILVQTEPGHEAEVRTELKTIAQGRLTVAPADQDLRLLRQALRPSSQASAFFAAIAGLLGFLFAFNAMLLTVPERRQTIADLRLSGTRRTAIVQMVLFQALCLGIAASLLGLLAGYGLSGSFHQSAGYLTQAFTLGGATVIGKLPVLLSFLGGILATCLASMVPLLDLRRGRAVDAVYFEEGEPGNMLGWQAPRNLACAAGGLLMLATAILLLLPSLALLACILLALTVVLAIPLIFTGVLRAAQTVARRSDRITILPVAIMSLKATTLRSLALAATGAVALFGSVALGGARDDLLRGIDAYTSHYVSGADIWLANPHDNQAINDFETSHRTASITRLPGVASVHTFQGSFLDYGKRRVWVIAWPPGVPRNLLDGQVTAGSSSAVLTRVRSGGWITVSQQIADEHGAGIGDTLTLPTPTGNVAFKVAATTTNFGWSPGAILMSTTDYQRSWATSDPTALGVDLTPGADAQAVRDAIMRELGPGSGLEVLTAEARAAKIDGSASEGLSKLSEISTLLLCAAILAIAAALTSAIWQRRASLAGLRLSGAAPHRLRRILLTEAVLMLAAACLTGAVTGVYGQLVIDSYLRHVTGFPVAGIGAGWRPLEIFALVIATVLAIVSVPAWLASRAPPRLALEGE